MCRSRLVLLVVGLLLLQKVLFGVACAQSETEVEKKSAPVDPAGTWKWQYGFNGNTADFTLKLTWDDKKLIGTYSGFNRTTEVEDVRLEKDQLSLVTKREFNGNEFVVRLNGKVKPDDIAGTVNIDFGGDGPRDFDWNPKRVVEIDDVVGTWQLHVETPNGAVEPRLTITKDGDTLRGKSATDAFGELEAKNVTLKDNVLSWEVTGANSGFEFQVKYRGKPRGNSIEGTNEFNVGSNTGTMKFTGKRMPAEKKQKERPATEEKPAAEAAPATEARPSDAEAESTASQDSGGP